MQHLAAEGLVRGHAVSFIELRRADGELVRVNVAGEVKCAAGVIVTVDKLLEVRRGRHGRYEVLGRVYRYHAYVAGAPVRDLLRYDSSHGIDRLHKHIFDARGREIAVEPVAFDSLPTLTGIIREAIALAG